MVCKHCLIVPDRNPELDHANRTLQAKCQRTFRRVFFGEVGLRSRYRRNRVHVATLSRQRAWMAVISHNGVSALLRDAPPISTHSDLKLYIVYGSTVICHMSWFYDMQIWWGLCRFDLWYLRFSPGRCPLLGLLTWITQDAIAIVV